MRPALFVRALLALAAAFALGGTLFAAPATSTTADSVTSRVSTQVTARAPGCIPRCWTAISFNTATLRGGWTQNGDWGTKAGAMSSALRHCRVRPVNAGHRQACVLPGNRDLYAQNGCVAVAWRVRNDHLVEWNKGKAFGPKAAMREARRKVDGRGTIDSGYSCAPRRWRG
ncbi:hypothetical protein [Nocardioides pelophilus]|uniref:hypothetical protein n=1 Tax=Nocardioides pelophilus TaxID=2172019 RepID=UPI0016010302|nr:hypothetical protein [Nocardioides pelophilus]